MRRDFALTEPPFICRVARRDKTASGFENLGMAADCVPTVDEIEDCVGAFRVVNSFGAEAASFVGVAANGRDQVGTAKTRRLHRVAADHNKAVRLRQILRKDFSC